VNFSDLLYLRSGGRIDVFCCRPLPRQPHPEPLGFFFTDSELREGPGELKEHGDPHLVAIPRQKPPHDTIGGDRTPSLPSRYGEVPALPPSPACAPRFVGADAADLAARCRRTTGGRATARPASVVTTLGTHHTHAGQSGPSRPKPAIGWAAMVFWPGQRSRPPDHGGFELGPDSTQQPVIFLFQF
jgi:hypothetical protein